jgi:VanZ family protein
MTEKEATNESRWWRFVKYWLPVLAWMAVIFAASGDRRSMEHSSRLIAPVIRWLFPHASQENVDAIVLGLRKAAHITEYAFLALLLWRAVGRWQRDSDAAWGWRKAWLTVLLVMLYAASDEFHQLFVPSRQASVVDVLIDTSGAVLALLFIWVVGLLRLTGREREERN